MFCYEYITHVVFTYPCSMSDTLVIVDVQYYLPKSPEVLWLIGQISSAVTATVATGGRIVRVEHFAFRGGDTDYRVCQANGRPVESKGINKSGVGFMDIPRDADRVREVFTPLKDTRILFTGTFATRCVLKCWAQLFMEGFDAYLLLSAMVNHVARVEGRSVEEENRVQNLFASMQRELDDMLP